MSSSETPAPYSEDAYEVRPARSNEETRQIWWPFMQGLGWNRGWYDLPTYMDPSRSSGMLLVFPKGDKKPVGHISAVINTNSTGWVSMFIVDAAYRGYGIGRGLFATMMREFHTNKVQIIGLDGVAEQKKTYERRGFVESKLGVVKLMTRPLVPTEGLHASASVEVSASAELLDLSQVPHYLLVEHDLKYTGFERRDLWTDRNLFDRPDVQGWALVSKAKLEAVDDIYAWAMVRRCSGGARVGPVYARDSESAKVVLAAATKTATVDYIKAVPMENEPMNSWSDDKIASGATLTAEVWTGNAQSDPVFEALGWRAAGFQYHRMWLDGKATAAQSEGGLAQTGIFAVFDAAVG